MDEHALRRILEGQGNGNPAGDLLRALLYLPGKAYGLAMRARRIAYTQNILKSHTAAVPVIAVGNLTAGGSGKTPMTLLIARELRKMGKTPAILLRGYRQTESAHSDEATLYQTLAPEIILRVDADRTRGAQQAIAAGADVLIMDDGFQHLRLRRDLDIVLIDATSPWGGGNTIPGGLLREPKSALKHAGLIVVTRSNQTAPDALPRLIKEIRSLAAPAAPILTATHQPARLYTFDDKDIQLDALRGRDVASLCGIARPEAFEATLRELGARIVSRHAGGDHHNFDRKFLLDALAGAAAREAVLVTTEKDRTKEVFADLAKENDHPLESLWILGIEQRVNDEAILLERIRGVFERRKSS